MASPPRSRCPHRAAWLLGLLFLVALRGGEAQTAAGPGASRPDGAAEPLVYGAGIVPHGIDPNRRATGWCEASSFLFSRLYFPGRDGRYHPDLASDFPREDAEGRIVRIPIRENVFWHDGEPFTAEDVAFTLNLLFEPLYPSDLGSNLPGFRSAVASGPREVLLEFEAPLPRLVGALAEIAILPLHRLLGAEGFPRTSPASFEEHPIGTGPYRFEAWVPATRSAPEGPPREEGAGSGAESVPPSEPPSSPAPDEAPPASPPRATASPTPPSDQDLLLVANPTFHLGPPKIPRIRMRVLPDDDARAKALADGSLDLAPIKPHHVAALLESGRVRIGRFRAGVWRGLELDTRRAPLADPRVRRAIDLALDRQRLVEDALGNYGKPAVLPLSLPHPDVPVAVPPVPSPDLTQAAILLEEAGWVVGSSGVRERKGKPLELRIAVWEGETFRRRASEMIRDWLESIGIVVHLQAVDQETYARIADHLEEPWDGTIQDWGARLDPVGNLYRTFHSRGSHNATGIADPELDRGLERLLHAPDPAVETETWNAVLDRILETRSVLALVRPDSLFAWSRRLRDPGEEFLDSWQAFPRFSWTWELAPAAPASPEGEVRAREKGDGRKEETSREESGVTSGGRPARPPGEPRSMPLDAEDGASSG